MVNMLARAMLVPARTARSGPRALTTPGPRDADGPAEPVLDGAVVRPGEGDAQMRGSAAVSVSR